MKKFLYLLSITALLSACSVPSDENGRDELIVDEEAEHNLVEAYLRENIGVLSPVAPVLGGSWYIVSVDFSAENQVHVFYEDGHIQEEFQASYTVSDSGQVELTLL